MKRHTTAYSGKPIQNPDVVRHVSRETDRLMESEEGPELIIMEHIDYSCDFVLAGRWIARAWVDGSWMPIPEHYPSHWVN